MSHHKSIYMRVDGELIKIGYARVTNEKEILSVWIGWYNGILFLPEGKI